LDGRLSRQKYFAYLSAFGFTKYVNLPLQEKEALRVLETITEALAGSKLHSLNLSDNALGEKGVRAAKAIFQGQVSIILLYPGRSPAFEHLRVFTLRSWAASLHFAKLDEPYLEVLFNHLVNLKRASGFISGNFWGASLAQPRGSAGSAFAFG
jgi:hypothetical protein